MFVTICPICGTFMQYIEKVDTSDKWDDLPSYIELYQCPNCGKTETY